MGILEEHYEKLQSSPLRIIELFALILANIAPLIAVFFYDWNAGELVLLYWCENIIIGLYAIAKIIVAPAQKSPTEHLGKIPLIPFFCLHYGGFCGAHGLFIIVLLKVGGGEASMGSIFGEPTWFGPLVFLEMLINVLSHIIASAPMSVLYLAVGLFAYHGLSFGFSHILKGGYKNTTPQKMMGEPYKRIVIMHIAIIAGAVPVQMMGSPAPMLALILFMKLAMDIFMFFWGDKAEAKATNTEEEEVDDKTAKQAAEALAKSPLAKSLIFKGFFDRAQAKLTQRMKEREAKLKAKDQNKK